MLPVRSSRCRRLPLTVPSIRKLPGLKHSKKSMKSWRPLSQRQKIIDEAELSGKTLLVAGVDASAESLAAAHYAVTAAELRGGDVLLVHAYPPPAAVAGHRNQSGPGCRG